MQKGYFVISLDFELYWGVRDKRTLKTYGENLLGVQQVIPKLLEIFDRYKIQATFATVGFLFFKNAEEWIQNFPNRKPNYIDEKLSPYGKEAQDILSDKKNEIYHFAPELIKLIKNSSNEIGCHTFSHFYCLEEGPTVEDFKLDLDSAKKIAEKFDITLQSIVFPRNQYSEDHLQLCKEEGFLSYRGTEQSWLYRSKRKSNETRIRRLLRLLDSYINISGHNCYSLEDMSGSLCNIPSSRILRAYSKSLRLLDWLRLIRIKRGMTYAAKNDLTYHLWWHPHNFGKNIVENFSFLDKILHHFSHLSKEYSFESITMTNLSKQIISNAQN